MKDAPEQGTRVRSRRHCDGANIFSSKFNILSLAIKNVVVVIFWARPYTTMVRLYECWEETH